MSGAGDAPDPSGAAAPSGRTGGSKLDAGSTDDAERQPAVSPRKFAAVKALLRLVFDLYDAIGLREARTVHDDGARFALAVLGLPPAPSGAAQQSTESGDAQRERRRVKDIDIGDGILLPFDANADYDDDDSDTDDDDDDADDDYARYLQRDVEDFRAWQRWHRVKREVRDDAERLPRFASATSFTYGEYSLELFARAVRAAGPRPGEHFVDIGSGCGRLVVAAALLFDEFRSCTGVELVRTLHDEALECTQQRLRRVRWLLDAYRVATDARHARSAHAAAAAATDDRDRRRRSRRQRIETRTSELRTLLVRVVPTDAVADGRDRESGRDAPTYRAADARDGAAGTERRRSAGSAGAGAGVAPAALHFYCSDFQDADDVDMQRRVLPTADVVFSYCTTWPSLHGGRYLTSFSRAMGERAKRGARVIVTDKELLDEPGVWHFALLDTVDGENRDTGRSRAFVFEKRSDAVPPPPPPSAT